MMHETIGRYKRASRIAAARSVRPGAAPRITFHSISRGAAHERRVSLFARLEHAAVSPRVSSSLDSDSHTDTAIDFTSIRSGITREKYGRSLVSQRVGEEAEYEKTNCRARRARGATYSLSVDKRDLQLISYPRRGKVRRGASIPPTFALREETLAVFGPRGRRNARIYVRGNEKSGARQTSNDVLLIKETFVECKYASLIAVRRRRTTTFVPLPLSSLPVLFDVGPNGPNGNSLIARATSRGMRGRGTGPPGRVTQLHDSFVVDVLQPSYPSIGSTR